MKRFLITIGISLMILYILSFALDLVISSNLKQSQTRMLIGWNELYKGNINADLLIIGNSRAWVQYNPMIIDSTLKLKSYVLGTDGSGIDRQILKYKTYRRFNKKPKIIVQNIEMFTITKTNGYEREQFFPYFYDDSLRTESCKMESFNLLERFIPCYRYIGYTTMIQEGLKINHLPLNDTLKNGYYGRNINHFNNAELNKLKTITFADDSSVDLIFKKYLKNNQKEQIITICVFAPVYYRAMNLFTEKNKMDSFYHMLNHQYNIIYLDYSLDKDIAFDSTYFYNSTHLNKKGSILFSTKLTHDLDSILNHQILH